MIDDARRARLLPLTRRIWPEAETIEILNGLRGCDPYTAFVRLDGSEIVLDISGNEFASDALESAIDILAQAPSTNQDLQALQQAYEEIKQIGLTIKDIDLTQTIIENANRLGIRPNTVRTIAQHHAPVAPPAPAENAPKWAISLALQWQHEAGRDVRTTPKEPLREKDVRTPDDRKPYTYQNPRLQISSDDQKTAAYYLEHPDELALHFARLRYQSEDKLRKLSLKHAQELLRSAGEP